MDLREIERTTRHDDEPDLLTVLLALGRLVHRLVGRWAARTEREN